MWQAEYRASALSTDVGPEMRYLYRASIDLSFPLVTVSF